MRVRSRFCKQMGSGRSRAMDVRNRQPTQTGPIPIGACDTSPKRGRAANLPRVRRQHKASDITGVPSQFSEFSRYTQISMFGAPLGTSAPSHDCALENVSSMKLADFLKKIEGLDPNTVLCVAEVDEAFGLEVADVEIVSNARQRIPDAADQENVDLANGSETVIVVRW